MDKMANKLIKAGGRLALLISLFSTFQYISGKQLGCMGEGGRDS